MKPAMIAMLLACACVFLSTHDMAVHAGAVRADDDRVMEDSVIIEAPVSRVWSMWTTNEGIRSWMVPNATIDLRVGGELRTSYNPDSTLDDDETIIHQILSYEPERMLSMKTIQAPRDFPWPEIFDSVWSVTYFEPLTAERCRVTLKSFGYKRGGVWDEAWAFFERGNAWTLQQLVGMAEGEAEGVADDMPVPEESGLKAMELSRDESFAILGRFVSEDGRPWLTSAEMDGVRHDAHDEFEWGAGGHLLKQRAHSVEDGARVLRYELMYSWDEARSRVVYTQYGSDGSKFSGEVYFTDADTIVYPPAEEGAGEASRYRQLIRFTGADSFDWIVEYREDGGWRPMITGAGARGGE